MKPMSLRTRQSLALPALLVMLVVACTGANPATNTPGAATATPGTSGGPTPVTTPVTSPGESTTPSTTPGESTQPSGPAGEQIFRIYCCSTDVRSLRPQAASGSDEISIIGGTQRGLLYRDGEGNLVPSLATDMPVLSDDGAT